MRIVWLLKWTLWSECHNWKRDVQHSKSSHKQQFNFDISLLGMNHLTQQHSLSESMSMTRLFTLSFQIYGDLCVCIQFQFKKKKTTFISSLPSDINVFWWKWVRFILQIKPAASQYQNIFDSSCHVCVHSQVWNVIFFRTDQFSIAYSTE